jgi:hypothetical protein
MGWAASVDFCPLLRHREMGRQVKKKQILMTWRVWGGGKKASSLVHFCVVGSLCFVLTTPPPPLQHLLTHYALELSGVLRSEPFITPWNVPLRPTTVGSF